MPQITLNNRYKYNPDTDLLGEGGLGTVYKAYDNQRRCYVAIKEFNVTGNLKYSLQEEFQKSIAFSHGNLVRSYDFFSTNFTDPNGRTHETQYGVMELIEGGDLGSYLKTKPPLPELLEVVKGILRGLNYLHTPDPNTDKGVIIHRDIKPANILIYRNSARQPIPKIADFNIAKEANSQMVVGTQTVIGTPAYMSPEQFLPKKLQPNTDLWSLGVLLCDHLLKKSIFDKRPGQTQGELMYNVLNKALPTTEIQNLRAPFNSIIAACLVRNAADRIQSADALLTLINEKEDTIIADPNPIDTIIEETDTIIPIRKPTDYVPYIAGGAILVVILIAWLVNGSTTTESVGGDKPIIKMISIPGRNFKLSETEVTIGQYLAFCKATNSHYPQWLEQGNEFNIYTGTKNWYKEVGMSESNTNYPITGVSALDADAFCLWMGGRLPTEQEWEYAAKGGNSYLYYAGSYIIDTVAWYNGNSGDKCHPVKQKQANDYGLYDMSGNVEEFTSSMAGPYMRVLCGGSWSKNEQFCRVDFRSFITRSTRVSDLGFRLALVP